MRAKIYRSKVLKGHQLLITMEIPASLAKIIQDRKLSKDQKMNLVKSYSEEMKDDNGSELERIPNTDAVAMLMALESEAL